ncbi:hypothetical protein FU454_08795 [Campylobacter jejuni]|nr:hypothetical protein [Campylobacter jejuni]ECP9441142.1 hypothetical protein [Campylobacter jejuni]HEC2742482.1 hypothetical protein [Campylobacter jejuni]HED7208664.1 hypothetical protein [Campylobacter jejuni]
MKTIDEIENFTEAVAEIISSYEEIQEILEICQNYKQDVTNIACKIEKLNLNNTHLHSEITNLATHSAASAKIAEDNASLIARLKSESLEIRDFILKTTTDFKSQLNEAKSNLSDTKAIEKNILILNDDFNIKAEKFLKSVEYYQDLVSKDADRLEDLIQQSLVLSEKLSKIETNVYEDKEKAKEYANEAKLCYEQIIIMRKRSACLIEKINSAISEVKKILQNLEDLILRLEQAYEKLLELFELLKQQQDNFKDIKQSFDEIIKFLDFYGLKEETIKEYLDFLKQLAPKLDQATDVLQEIQIFKDEIKTAIITNTDSNAQLALKVLNLKEELKELKERS